MQLHKNAVVFYTSRYKSVNVRVFGMQHEKFIERKECDCRHDFLAL